MKHILPRTADNLLSGQELHALIERQMLLVYFTRIQPLDHDRSQIKPVHIITIHLYKLHLFIILPYIKSGFFKTSIKLAYINT
jgi:hypothetical protein